jgi:Holliday junction DNA helicase RuvB
MEDFCIDILIDQGPQARSIRLDLPRFTLVGATTRTGLLTPPLRSRFTLQTRLGYYEVHDLTQIVLRSARLLPVEIDRESAEEIAHRSRGTPRVANNLLGFIRDYCQQQGQASISLALTRDALELLEIDASGLDEMDKQILNCLAENYHGGPVGIGTLAAAIGEDRHTLEEVHEPYLVQEGYLQRTPQGRLLTPKAWEKLGLMPVAKDSLQSEIHF